MAETAGLGARRRRGRLGLTSCCVVLVACTGLMHSIAPAAAAVPIVAEEPSQDPAAVLVPELGAIPPAPAAPQVLRVRLAYAPSLRQRSSWSSQFQCAFERASNILEPLLGIELELAGRTPWLGGDRERTLQELRQDLSGIPAKNADIVVGLRPGILSSRLPPGAADFTQDEGLAHYTLGYVVLEIGAGNLCDLGRLLAHELAHVYGGVHRTDPDSLMNVAGRGVEADALNVELFGLHKGRRFGAGKAPLGGEDLRSMWRLASADIEDPSTWVVVGILAARIGNPEAAASQYQRALDLEPSHYQALLNLGHVWMQLDRLEDAEETYLRALDANPSLGLAHNNLAAIYFSRGQAEASLTHAKTALGLDYSVDLEFIRLLEKETGKSVRDR